MHALVRLAVILGLTFALSACGGSGGGTSGTVDQGGEQSCGQPDCGRDNDTPSSEPAPSPTPAEPTEPEPPLICGGVDPVDCPAGYRCVADPTTNCDPATGMTCAGICVLGNSLPGCGGMLDQPCPDGQTCADDPADDCAGGPAVDCPGVCRPVAGGECTDDTNCPVLDAQCSVCADGSVSCPESHCLNGGCVIEFKPCSPPPVCGGGVACPPGFQCIDDRTDGCGVDPAEADCPGICVPDSRPPGCGGITGEGCPPGFECVDDPNDMCTAENGADCPGICQPASGGECTSDEECPTVLLPCSACADGNEVCPRAVCEHGRCSLAFPACPIPPGCTTDADCGAEQVCIVTPDAMCDPTNGVNCGGFCIPKVPERPCGDDPADACPEGYVCSGAPGDDCEPDAAGNGCARVCVPAPQPSCETSDDCAMVGGCNTCPDGSVACSQAECRDGVCVADKPPCAGPEPCRADDDCAGIDACTMCPDGAVSCARPECHNGVCAAVFPACPNPDFCGGIAGFPCPPGFTCVDRPDDECDPNQGGADCEGVCRREEDPRKCSGFAGETCPPGYECVDAMDDCESANGGADCPGFCRPAPSPGCASDADCPLMGAPCQVCADGTAACPSALCDAGQCRYDFPSCERGEDPNAG